MWITVVIFSPPFEEGNGAEIHRVRPEQREEREHDGEQHAQARSDGADVFRTRARGTGWRRRIVVCHLVVWRLVFRPRVAKRNLCGVKRYPAEAPIMDGSSIQFVQVLKEAETEDQNALRDFFEVQDSIFYRETARHVEIAALPLDDYRVTVMIDYNSPVLGSQHASITNIQQFEKEIASCRTFCFLHELEMLYKNNLIKGGEIGRAHV